MDTVWPLPPAAPASSATQARPGADPALLGLIIGAAVPAIVACVAWWLDQPYVAAVAGVGVVVGAAIGAAAGPRLVGPDWVGATILAALVAPLVPGLVIAAFLVLASLAGAVDPGAIGVLSWLGSGLLYAVLVLVIAEMAGAPITLPVALVVAILVRRAARMRRERAAIHVGLLAVVALIAGTITLVGMSGAFGVVGALHTIHGH